MTGDLESARILGSHLAFVSLFSVGGAHVMLPDIYRVIVTQQQWIEPQQFSQIVALSQAAPGPNVLVMAMLGYAIGGLPFAALATLAFVAPTSVICYLAASMGARGGSNRWKDIAKLALGPMTAGLVIASGLVLARGAEAGAAGWVLTAIGAYCAAFTKVSPLLVVIGAGVVGLLLP